MSGARSESILPLALEGLGYAVAGRSLIRDLSARLEAGGPSVILAGFGRAIAEVGAVIIVGGNIAHVTRVVTTAIALETRKGDLALALALGIVLLGLSLVVNAGAALAGELAGRAER